MTFSQSPKFEIYSGNHLQALLDALAFHLDQRPASPLEQETVIVQSQGMSRWLTLQLSQRFGVVAGLAMPFPASFCKGLCARLLGRQPDRGLEPAAMTWRIFASLAKPQTEGSLLAHYLDDDQDGRRRYQLSCRLARLFDDYQLYRPQMIAAWQQNTPEGGEWLPHEQWQATLFQELHQDHDGGHLAEQLHKVTARLHENGATDLPLRRLSIFGITSLPPAFIDLLMALSLHIPVRLYYLNPCREYWADIPNLRQLLRRQPQADPEELPEVGNPFLASFGKQGRDFFCLLLDRDQSGQAWQEADLDREPLGDSLLARMQRDVLTLQGDELGEKIPMAATDRSITLHSCHSPLREMEVLRDQLLAAFDEIDDLRPDQILVMVPDIARYGPYIQAVFGIHRPEEPSLPFSIADRADGHNQPLVTLLTKVIDLSRSRLTLAQVLELLTIPAVANRFDLLEQEVDDLAALLKEAGIRWGLDSSHRASFQVPASSTATWRQGIERLLLGYAMGDRPVSVGGLVPTADPTNSRIDLLERFLEFFDSLTPLLTTLAQPHSLADWPQLLRQVLDNLCQAKGEQDEQGVVRVRRVIDQLAEAAFGQEPEEGASLLSSQVVSEYLEGAFAEDSFGHGFIDGRITFCAMKPMRTIPFRVMALCGMNDSDFPRRTPAPAFDLMAAKPRLGDRNLRDDDRYLFLESILAAQERLIVTWVGRDRKTNEAKPASVCLEEFLDLLARRYQGPERGDLRQHLITNHPLQSFSAAYFTDPDEARFFTYSRTGYQASRAEISQHQPLAESSLEVKHPETVPLDELIRFWSNPSAWYCRHILEVWPGQEDEELAETEPFACSALTGYQITSQLVAQGLSNHQLQPDLVCRALQQEASLPPASLGRVHFNRLQGEAESFVRQIPDLSASRELEIDLTVQGVGLTGKLKGIMEHGVVIYRPARAKAADRVTAWLSLLAARAMDQNIERCTGCFREATMFLHLKDDPLPILSRLLEGYLAGQQQPLPLFPQTSEAYAKAWLKTEESEDKKHRHAMAKAWKSWRASSHRGHGRLQKDGNASRGQWQVADKDDPAVALCFRDQEPLVERAEEFAAWSLALWEPLLSAIRKG